MKKLRQVSVIGMGLLGASVTLTILRALPGVKTVVFSHRPFTRRKAEKMGVADEVVNDIKECVCQADIVILATPIGTFEDTFRQIADALPDGCIVTDVGSTKVLPHRWAQKTLPERVRYVGSHPIAGSEKRGVEFARDDLLSGAACIVTKTKNTNTEAVRTLKSFWSSLGSVVKVMTPVEHDKIFANVSHLPHVMATALINASKPEDLKFAGKGFMDTSRIASGPANIWADILITNSSNTARGIDRAIKELLKLKKAIQQNDQKQVERLLDLARTRRSQLIGDKLRKKEILS